MASMTMTTNIPYIEVTYSDESAYPKPHYKLQLKSKYLYTTDTFSTGVINDSFDGCISLRKINGIVKKHNGNVIDWVSHNRIKKYYYAFDDKECAIDACDIINSILLAKCLK